ncbi:MAG TPA: hypothetical protein DIU00_00860 [Phycisphaerales bacterium]|nr:hypothetical protein [Phycisphaerales bacterium]
MNSPENIEKLIKNAVIHSNPDVNQAVLKEFLQQFNNTQEQKPVVTQPNIRRKIMKSPITKLAAAAVIIIAVMLSINIWDNITPAAYALDQTVQASHSVRYLHIKSFKKGMEEPKEFWLEFDEQGDIKNIRAHMPEWESPSDGAKVVIWQQGKAKIWYKKKKSLLIIKDKRFADKLSASVQLFDPKLAVPRFIELEKSGFATIKIEKPSNKAEPIIISATYSPECKKFGVPVDRTVLFVDQTTKLITSMESYSLTGGGEYELIDWVEFYDYNQQIDPAMFVFDNLPSDVVQIDQTIQDIGLEQGELSSEEIAVKVVREFYEAVIAKDYAKAGRIYGGVPAKIMEERWADLKVIRIISISEPIPHPSSGVGGFMVPCKLEIEKDGVKSEYKPYGPGVRAVHGQPNRWNIHGGVK